MNSELIESLRQRVAEVGLTPYSEAIVAAARPAVDFYLDAPSDGTVGESL